MTLPRLPGHPTTLHFGVGISAALASTLPAGAPVLLVASAGMRQRCSTLLAALAARVQLHVADPVPAATTHAALSALLAAHRGRRVALVLALGGGTTMDAAKVLAFGLGSAAPLDALLATPAAFAAVALPLVCLPTTSGSGSDVTPYATVWDVAAGRKRSLTHAALVPVASWVDPALATSLPAAVTASSGLDALAHAVEAVWSRRHDDEADSLALPAAAAIVQHLPRALAAPRDLAARTALAHAALAAGLAISRTQTAAAHAGSYALTLRHGVVHGHACALSLPWLLRWHGTFGGERIGRLAAALGAADADAGARVVERLIVQTGLAPRLRDLGVPRGELPALAAAALASDRIANTLQPLPVEAVGAMFESIW